MTEPELLTFYSNNHKTKVYNNEAHKYCSYILGNTMKIKGCLQQILPKLQLAGLPVTNITQLLLQTFQFDKVFLIPSIQQSCNLLIKFHIYCKPFLQNQHSKNYIVTY